MWPLSPIERDYETEPGPSSELCFQTADETSLACALPRFDEDVGRCSTPVPWKYGKRM
jgi:hypothetical protein